MPKKRSFNKYSKPPTTAPSSLASTSTSSQNDGHSPSNADASREPNTVNGLLTKLRQSTARPHQQHNDLAIAPQDHPSVPPDIHRLLQLPEPNPLQLPLRERLRQNGNAQGPAYGPPAPQSWQLHKGNRGILYRPAGVLDDDYAAERGSLLDMSLRVIVSSWQLYPEEFAEAAGELYLLPNHLREALIRELGRCLAKDFTLGHFKCIVAPPQGEDGRINGPENWDWNRDFRHLSIPPSLLTSTTFPALISYLFPKKVLQEKGEEEVKESWDVEDAPTPIPRQLIPVITHLSLAIPPGAEWSDFVPSWKHLLIMTKKLPGLTHLSLAYWPKPMRTPHAMNASFVGGPRAVAYSSTTMYSHSLDQDWSEAVHIIRQLSKNLYQLKHLDITGCTPWFQAMIGGIEYIANTSPNAGFRSSPPRMNHLGTVDWVRGWGNMETIRMRSGLVIGGAVLKAEDRAIFEDGIQLASQLERIITAHRGGMGKIITVEKDDLYDLRPRLL